MRLFFWVTALAVLSLSHAKNTTEKSKPKRQLENIRTPQNLQYSLVLPNSRVTHFRSLGGPSRRISHGSPRGNLPPYAVQMEPVVQYSQKDPLYDPSLENRDEVVDKNELYAQAKILNGHDQTPEGTYGAHYGSLPTAPLYSHEPHPHYYEAPEPIIEIIIKESNETLPPPPPQPILKKKKEPVQVFYVKYSKDPYAKDKVVYDKPVPAVTPASNDHDEHEHDHQDYVTVTPEPYYDPPPTTTLRAIIKPDSEVYHSDSTVKVTFGNEGHHSFYSDRREGNANNEEREETAPHPAIAYPQQQEVHPPLERSAKPNNPIPELFARPHQSHPGHQNYRNIQGPSQHAQNRIQYNQQFVGNEQQLPRQGPSISPFRGHVARQNPFPSPSPTFSNQPPGPINHFSNSQSVLGPLGPIFSASQSRPSGPPSFHPRPNSQPPFAPRPHFNGPPRPSFHSGPQRPFPPPQSQQLFDETKYLQENYHTITSEQLEPSKDQPTNKVNQNNNFIPKPNPGQFEDNRKPQHVPQTQQLPQQRPHQPFIESSHNRPTFAISPNRPPPFFNLKPSPPHIEESRIPFQQSQPQQPPFSFHQGIQSIPRPPPPTQNQNNAQRFPGPISPSPSPSIFPSAQFLPQPSTPPHFNYHAHLPSQSPSAVPNHFPSGSPSERPPQFQQFNTPSERPDLQQNENFQAHRQHGVGHFIPKGGELVAAIPKYEQHITVSGPSGQADYSGLAQQGPSAASADHVEKQYQQQQEQQYHQQQQQQQHQQQQQQLQQQEQHQRQLQQQKQQQEQQHRQLQQQQQQEEQQLIQQQQQQQRYEQGQQQQQQQQQQQRQQHFDVEQEQLRQQLAENVQKQQAEIQRLQSQLLQAQNQQIHESQQFRSQQTQATSPQPQYSQERSRPIKYALSQQSFPSSSAQPYYQSTSRTVEIRPTTQKYRSSTINSINPTPEPKKEQKKKKPSIELPDEVPDDLRQQLLSSGILDNADISVLDYDKVGDTPLDSLPPDQLANFFSAGGGQQIAASENRPIVVAPTGENIQSRIDEEDDDDQDIAASETIANYEAPPSETKQAVEMKVVHFNPDTADGRKLAKDYVQDDATRLDPVALNDKKYNRYLPLKVSGNQFPLPDVLKGRKVTSVVVLAPVETEVLNNEHSRPKRAANKLKGIKFIAGDSLQDLLKQPTRDNFEKWLKIEKNTAADLQSVVLLVTGTEDESADKEIYMYDISSGKVNKLNGELSNAFVEAAENNALSRDIEKLAIEGEGTPENFQKSEEDTVTDGSENVPFLVDLSGLSLEQDNPHVSISSGYSKTKLGRSLKKY